MMIGGRIDRHSPSAADGASKRTWAKSPRLWLTTAAVSLVAAYLFFCPALNEPLYQLLAVMPSHEYIDTSKACAMGPYIGEHRFFSVFGAEGSTTLHGIYFRCHDKPARGVVIMNPGNAFCVAHMLGCKPSIAILSLGWDLFVYDYEGYGESDGVARYKNLGKDGLSACEFVRNQLKPARVVLYGMSMGGGITSYVAERVPVDGVIYDSPFISPALTVKDWLPLLKVYPSAMFPQPSYDNGKYLAGKHPPALIITKGCDSVCWPAQGKELARMASAPTTAVVLPTSQHLYVDGADEAVYMATLKKFLDTVGADAR